MNMKRTATFLLSQYFRDNFNKAMQRLPIVQSNVQILRVEVWVTNRTGATTDTRDVVGFMDLGEGAPYKQSLGGAGATSLPFNKANNLYDFLNNPANGDFRNSQ